MSSPNAAPPPPPAAAATTAAAAARKGLPSKVYDSIIRTADKFVPDKLRPFWNHPAGPKTIFFYAPLFKWTLVFAGLSDLRRPAEELSIGQCASLAATGLIWSRYSLVIIPKNYGLFSVNLFVALTQLVQLGRAYNASQDKKKAIALAEAEAQPVSK